MTKEKRRFALIHFDADLDLMDENETQGRSATAVASGAKRVNHVESVQGEDAVTAVIEQLYEALGDRPAFDEHLHEGITIWESDADHMLRDGYKSSGCGRDVSTYEIEEYTNLQPVMIRPGD